MRRRMECPLRQIMPVPHAVRMDSEQRPGDLIIDRYLPDIDPEKREEAREALRAHALLLIRIGERIMADVPNGDSPESVGRRRIQPPTL